jgi:nucleotide-binding universal stress UspA family protein
MIEEIKKILVPMDGSSYSKRAAATAISVGVKFNSKITFITAISAQEIPPPGQLLGILKNDKNLERKVHEIICTIRMEVIKMLKDQVSECKKSGISGEYEILEGHPVSAILNFSKTYGPDLIVIGSHGLTGLSKIKACIVGRRGVVC